LPRRRVISSLGFVGAALLAVATAGCSGTSDAFKSDAGWFSKPFAVFSRPDGSEAADAKGVQLGPSGPVAAEDLVGADGRCALPAETPQAANQPTPAAPPADRPVGSVAGDLASPPMRAAANPADAPAGLEPGAPPVVGGIALEMTECDVVRRAGLPSNVNIGVTDNNQRKVVLTYLSGNWPGIYSFASGRLKEISRAPEQPKPAKAPPKKKSKKVADKKPPQPAAMQVR